MTLDAKTRINKTTVGNLALKGYDTVAYFREGRPVEGREKFAQEWMDATWRFASAENREAFAKDPERYAPQYGGYCAWGISQAKFYDGDPLVWKIVNGKLYVNFNKEIEKAWEGDLKGFIGKADAAWPTLVKE